MIQVYTQDNCPACKVTVRMLNQHQVQYEDINISHNPKAKQYLLNQGWKGTPVVNNNGQWFSGFRPDRLNEILYENAHHQQHPQRAMSR